MPQPTLVALVALGLAAQFSPIARQHAPAASAAEAAEARLACSFKEGPRAGHQQTLPQSTTLKFGEACSDDAGSTGIVIFATTTSSAGVSDSMDKVRSTVRNDTESARPEPRRPPAASGSPAEAEREENTTQPSEAADHAGGTGVGSGAAAAPRPPPPPSTAATAATAAEPTPQHNTAAPAPAPKPELPAQAQGPAPSAPPDESEQVHRWFQSLQKGSAIYSVPATMVLGQTYSATAVIHPPTSPQPASPDAHALKISPYMRIVLSQTGNPGTFDIRPDGNDCKFVSTDADTTWVFNVKPLLPGKDRALDFAAYVVYGTGDTSCRPENLKTIDVLSDTERVTIAAITRQQAWQEMVVSFVTDPSKWFKFILPGGIGFAALKWLITWWNKRRKAAKPTTAPAPHTP